MPIGPRKIGPPEVLETYRKKTNLWGNLIRNHVPHFKPLRHDG
jgi:hypothetical protein